MDGHFGKETGGGGTERQKRGRPEAWTPGGGEEEGGEEEKAQRKSRTFTRGEEKDKPRALRLEFCIVAQAQGLGPPP